MRNLNTFCKQEQEEFLKSFDYVLCDVDGVLLLAEQPIPGSVETINSIKRLGKKVAFVSNNNTKSQDVYFNQLHSVGVKLEKDDLIQPVFAMISYLKSVNMTKEIYLIGMTPMRQELEKAGFKIADYGPDKIEESDTVADYIKLVLVNNPKVGAVIADVDINMNMIRLQRAATYLKNPDVLFITGGSDVKLIFGKDTIIIGPGSFHNILEDITERKKTCLAKPSSDFNEFIKKKLNIQDLSRVLFIGDSVPEDMGFATNCGYKKLLVFSGLTRKDSLTNWTFPEEFKPDYYVDSLKDIQDLINPKNKCE